MGKTQSMGVTQTVIVDDFLVNVPTGRYTDGDTRVEGQHYLRGGSPSLRGLLDAIIRAHSKYAPVNRGCGYLRLRRSDGDSQTGREIHVRQLLVWAIRTVVYMG